MALHIDTTPSLELYKLLKVRARDIQSRKRMSPQAKLFYIQKHLSRSWTCFFPSTTGFFLFVCLFVFVFVFLRERVVWVLISYINKLMYE